jgi:hypothetical protein
MLAEPVGKGECHLHDMRAAASTDLHRPSFPIERAEGKEGHHMNGTSTARPWTIRRAILWVVILALGFAIATWLRYGLIQPQDIGILCGQADAPGWCTPRQWLVVVQHHFIWGWIALVSAAIGLLIPLPRPLGAVVIAVAILFSALALMLYNATLGAPALVLTLLALLRR